MSPMFDTWVNHGFVAIETKKTHGQHEESITEEATPSWVGEDSQNAASKP